MVLIPERVVGGLCAADERAVLRWWAGLDEATAAALVGLWAEAAPSDARLEEARLEEGEGAERARERAMWRRDYREYLDAHPGQVLLESTYRFSMLSPPRWKRFRRFQPDGTPVLPDVVRPIAWKWRSWRFRR